MEVQHLCQMASIPPAIYENIFFFQLKHHIQMGSTCCTQQAEPSKYLNGGQSWLISDDNSDPEADKSEDKPSKYICNFVKVCSGERGKAILRESNAHKEEKDYQVFIKALEQKVKPSKEELSASSKYFYLRQGNATLVDFFKQATEIVEAMNINKDPKDKTLRNLFMNGLTSREIYRECLKEKADQISSKRLSKCLSCDWYGGRKRCRRQKCPAKDSKCNKCGKMGHWGKVCRMKNRAGNVKTRVHRIMDSNDHDQSDEDDATSVDFDSLNIFPDPKDPHLRLLWFSDPQKSDIHLIEAKVDSGPGCNTFPLYVYKKIFGTAPMDQPSVIKKAYRDQPASIRRNGLHQLSSSKTANTTVKTYCSREIEDINKEKLERQIVTVPKQGHFNPINLNLNL
ncbi:hypothetical protein CAPTEDRAFT_206950 [Capitella teleta]|uniref:CCHC-type domain-containing protein n=1 Tax=Capitella teleta TaxID=283909 RepID=R7UTB6_CAPTE|nr:hypothetical protein CAPTEDRAFT_206950 [Capitella teleta]|eukprot:ELU09754.1 hypothetical protein CAPTEDRAFT_206950 [Capitella teleta]